MNNRWLYKYHYGHGPAVVAGITSLFVSVLSTIPYFFLLWRFRQCSDRTGPPAPAWWRSFCFPGRCWVVLEVAPRRASSHVRFHWSNVCSVRWTVVYATWWLRKLLVCFHRFLPVFCGIIEVTTLTGSPLSYSVHVKYCYQQGSCLLYTLYKHCRLPLVIMIIIIIIIFAVIFLTSLAIFLVNCTMTEACQLQVTFF